MKHKISLILLVTLSFSLFSFYSVHKIKNKVNWFPQIRHLDGATDQQIEDLCKNADEKLYNYYYKDGSYDSQSNDDTPDDSQTLINLIKDGSSEDVKEYVKKCAKWLVFIVFGILAIIGWIVCCCCCCCNCCCFKNCCTSKILQFIIFVLCAACYGCVAILGIYTAASANNAIKGLNNTSCSLLRFVDDIINGQKKETKPYWKGIDGLKVVLQSIKDGIDYSIRSKKDTFYQSTGDYSTYVASTNTKLTQVEALTGKYGNNTYYYFNLTAKTSPDYAAKTLSPTCIKEWDTYKPQFRPEYDGLVAATQSTLQEMESNFNEVTGCERGRPQCTESDTFKAITESIDAIDEISSSFKNIQSDITDPWYDLQSTINDIANKSLKIAGSVICVFCASVCVLILLYKLLGCVGKIFKIVIHVLWNIVALTIIVSFIVGGVIGLLGKIGIDLVSVMKFIVSRENLNAADPVVIGNVNNKDYLITCLHEDGDLAGKLNLRNDAKVLDDLNEIKNRLTTLQQNYGDKQQSIKPTEYYNLISNYYNYKFYEFTVSSNSFGEEYNINNEIKDVNDKITLCSTPEYWGTDKNNRNGYNEIEVGNYGTTPIDHGFIYLYDLESVIYTNRYSTCGADAQNVANNVGDRLVELNTFFKGAEMDNLKTKELEMKNDMDKIYQNLNKAIDSSLEIISSITDQLNDNVGEDGELWGMINCKFMGKGIDVLLKNIHDGLGKRFVNLGNTLVAMAFLEAFAIVFTLLTLKKPDKDPNEKK